MTLSMILEQFCFALIKIRTCPKSFKKQKMNENGYHKRRKSMINVLILI